jgi:hypothetical protein
VPCSLLLLRGHAPNVPKQPLVVIFDFQLKLVTGLVPSLSARYRRAKCLLSVASRVWERAPSSSCYSACTIQVGGAFFWTVSPTHKCSA